MRASVMLPLNPFHGYLGSTLVSSYLAPRIGFSHPRPPAAAYPLSLIPYHPLSLIIPYPLPFVPCPLPLVPDSLSLTPYTLSLTPYPPSLTPYALSLVNYAVPATLRGQSLVNYAVPVTLGSQTLVNYAVPETPGGQSLVNYAVPVALSPLGGRTLVKCCISSPSRWQVTLIRPLPFIAVYCTNPRKLRCSGALGWPNPRKLRCPR